MDTDVTLRRGQAAVEFAIGVFLLAFVIALFAAFTPVFTRGLDQQSVARLDAGLAAVSSSGAGNAVTDGGVETIASLATPPDAPPASQIPPETKALRLIPGFSSSSFDIALDFMGVPFFDGKFTLREETYIPASGGGE